MGPPPTAADLEAYRRGNLAPQRFAVVDAWIAAQDTATQITLLEEPTGGAGSHAPLQTSTPALTFATDTNTTRYRLGGELGRGGMGIVYAAIDTVLDRPVALKVLRPRADGEDMAQYALRLRLFRREAGLLAGLDHPAIVTVHDVGYGPHGEPAYIMRRLDGAPLSSLIEAAQQGNGVGPARAAEIVLRAAEAMGAAHACGVIHRDLKPDNIWAGAHGEVVIIDWGLATRRNANVDATDVNSGSDSAIGNDTAAGVGTPAWMAPEQAQATHADPRMDVYALGAVLNALLTGQPPAAPRIQQPRSLAAVVQRCLAVDPNQRYPTAAALAEDLLRWFSAGLTEAERPSQWRRLRAWMHLHPASTLASLGLAMLLGAVTVGSIVAHRSQVRQTISEAEHIFATTVLNDRQSVFASSERMTELQRTRGGHDPRVVSIAEQLHAADTVLEQQAATERERQALRALAQRYDRQGPWATEAADLRAGLAEAGIVPGDTQAPALVRQHPLRNELLHTLTHLARLTILNGGGITERQPITNLLRAVDDPGWAAMGDLLDITRTNAHDLEFCDCAFSEIVLRDRETADVLLSVFGPEARLVNYAETIIVTHPGAFWPRIILARAAIGNGDSHQAREHALVALGVFPDSLWPHVQLAYAALIDHSDAELTLAVDNAKRANPEHAEVRLLDAVMHARSGDLVTAQQIAERIGAAHLQYHLQHPVGHPMELAVRALVAAGVNVAVADPALGPLVPHH